MTAAPSGPAASLRVLDTGAHPPAWNMAFDEVLLGAGGPPTLRLYRWDPPGLSLGRFQTSAAFAGVPGPHRLVRRRTGGGAIYHDDEITFALTLDAEILPGDVAGSYALLHRAVQQALAAVGVATELVPGTAAPTGRSKTDWCFARPGPHDLVLTANGRKLVGSAQRRVREPRPRVLHHGSLVLQAPTATPFCASVGDVIDPRRVEGPLRQGLIAALGGALGLRPCPDTPSAAELAAAEALAPAYLSADPTRP